MDILGFLGLSGLVSNILMIGGVTLALYFSTTIKALVSPLLTWIGDNLPGVTQYVKEGAGELTSLTLKAIVVLGLIGAGLFFYGKTGCDCKAKVDYAIQDLRKDYQFVPRKKAKSTGGLFNVF